MTDIVVWLCPNDPQHSIRDQADIRYIGVLGDAYPDPVVQRIRKVCAKCCVDAIPMSPENAADCLVEREKRKAEQ